MSINQKNHSNQADSQSLRSESKVPQSKHNQQRIERQDSGDHSSRSGERWSIERSCIWVSSYTPYRLSDYEHPLISACLEKCALPLFSPEVDVSSLCSALERRVSVDTVATDPWLRPGTSDAAKRLGCGEKPTIRMDTPPWLTHRVT